jgi:hypothetical protein
MGAPESGIQAANQGTAETLLATLRTIKPEERAKHETIVDYWLSIRGDKELPPLHDLDPLEISDAGPNSILLELIGGGQDAEIRHLGDALNEFCASKRVIDAPNPSVLHSISTKLPIVAISRDILAYEDDFSGVAGRTRCWVTLLPLSSCGSWVDYVYAFVSVETGTDRSATAPTPVEPVADVASEEVDDVADAPVEPEEAALEPAPAAVVEAEPEEVPEPEPVAELGAAPVEAAEDAPGQEPVTEEVAQEPVAAGMPGFSKLLEGAARLAGFYGQGVSTETVVPTMELKDSAPEQEEPLELDQSEVEPEAEAEAEAEAEVEHQVFKLEEAEPVAEAEALAVEEPPVEVAVAEVPAAEPDPVEEAVADHVEGPAPDQRPTVEGPLQQQLAQVRAKAEEARQAQLRVTQALHESLSAAYDFAVDAEGSPQEYLRLVEAEGVKIQLRAPMAPVAKLAFDDVCDPGTIRQFEAVLAWALKVELPRGALLGRIESAGGVAELLDEFSRAA